MNGKEKMKRPDKVIGSSIRGTVRIERIVRASSTEPGFTYSILNPSSQQTHAGIVQVIISYTIQSQSEMGKAEGAIAWCQ